MYFAFKPYIHGIEQAFSDLEPVFQSLNTMLILLGLSISFASLQDTKKTNFKFEKKLLSTPKYTKTVIIAVLIVTLLMFIYGILAFLIKDNENVSEITNLLSEMAVGCIVMGIGLIAYMKFIIEVIENHQPNKA